jgi:hypothetical protein
MYVYGPKKTGIFMGQFGGKSELSSKLQWQSLVSQAEEISSAFQ